MIKDHTIAFRMNDPMLEHLVREQIALEHIRILDEIDGGQHAEILITDGPVTGDGLSIEIGKDIDFPVRLGEFLDRLHYQLSGRTRFSADGEKWTIGPFDFKGQDSILIHLESGQMIRLTDKERLMLQTLYHAPNQRLSRQDLLDQVWGYAEGTETHTLETHIYRLRQKIEAVVPYDIIVADGAGFYALFHD